MESRINYALIGLFVLLLSAAAIIIPLWLSAGLDQQQYRTYLVYMNESVDGLSLNAPVKYNGVNVGYVRDISLNLHNPEQVKILLNVKQNIPITTNTTAELRNRGITGVVYIGLNGGNAANAQPLTPQPGMRYAMIKVAPSIRVKLDAGATKLVDNLDQITQQLETIFNKKNTAQFNQMLNNLNKITTTLAANTQSLNNTFQSLNILTTNLAHSSQSLPNVFQQIELTSQNLQEFSNDLRENPSILLRGKTPLLLGPGEEKP